MLTVPVEVLVLELELFGSGLLFRCAVSGCGQTNRSGVMLTLPGCLVHNVFLLDR